MTAKKERLCALTAFLTSHPNELYTLSYFSECFGAAKSTLSEDLNIVKETLLSEGMGDIETVLGASGGVKYLPVISAVRKREIIETVCAKLREPSRILPGGFIYTVDIFHDPKTVNLLARIIWEYFFRITPDFVITVESKGIPLAMETARLFACPLVVVRKENKLTEGSAVTINYIAASSNRLQTLSLSKRAVKEGQRTLIVDDFIAGGGTVRAVTELMKEFRVTVLGCGAGIAAREQDKRRMENIKSIFTLERVDSEREQIIINPTAF